jgi:hypothetical protein
MSVYKECPNCKKVHDWSLPCSALLTKEELRQIDHNHIVSFFLTNGVILNPSVSEGHRIGPKPNLSQYDGDRSD